jgi:subtilisin family serine protease
MSRKFIQITFSILLLAGMVLGFAIKDGVLAQDNPEVKIEADLVKQLAAGPADFIVKMAEQADVSGAYQLQTKAEKGQYVFDTLMATAARTQPGLLAYLDSQNVEYKSFYIFNGVWVKQGTLAQAQAIAARADVAAVNVNHTFQLDEPINAQPSTNQPNGVEANISFVKADQVWAMGVTGEGTVVADDDTGLDNTHPTIAPHYRGCVDPPECTEWDHNYNWFDAFGDSPDVPWDDYGHGTHTAGTMVGDDYVGNQIGMAPGAKLISCKNMQGGGGDDAHFIICFQWNLAPTDTAGNNPRPDLAPDSVNNSWGYGGGGVEAFREIIDNLLAAGIVVEVSAGNEGSGCSTLRSPGDYQEVFTTGSVNHAYAYPGLLTGFSSRGPSILDGDYFPDFMAPGENVRSALPGNSYGSWSGTSMAGPHVTALVALIWSGNPALRGQIDTTYEIIRQTVVPLTGQDGYCGGDYVTGPNNDWGYGTIDALAAVQLGITMGGAGAMDGTVSDAVTGEPIVDANVFALHEGGFGRNAQTDPTGYYTMTLASGLYTVTASHPAYESMEVTGVEVITDMVTTQPFELTPRGILTGKVTDFDNGFPLVGATLTAEDGTTVTTDANGEYTMYLDAGTHDVTASMKDYADLTETVDMVSGETTVQDFALQAAVVFIPSPLKVTVDMESTASLDASILNRQNIEYPFEFVEKDEGFNPALESLLKLDIKGSPSVAPSNTAVAAGPYQPRLDGQQTINRHNSINQANVLLLNADDDNNGSSPIQQLLLAYGDLGAVDLYDARYSTPTVEFLLNYNVVVVWANYVFADATAMGNVLADYVDAGGKVIDLNFALDPNWGYMGRFRFEGYTAMTGTGTIYSNSCLGTFDDTHPIMEGVSNVCDLYRQGGTVLTAGSYEVALWQDGQIFVAAKDDGSVVTINAYPGIYYQYTGQLPDVLHNAINFISVPPDVPWLGEDPVVGVVDPESELPVTIYFTATQAVGINQPGDYLATLKLNGTPKVNIPVVMTVPAPETWGKIEGAVTDKCTGLPIEEALLSIPDGVPITQTLTNEAGIYSIWLDANTYEATFSANGFVDYPTTFEITPGELTILNVSLTPAFGCLTYDPASMEVTVDMGNSTTLPLTLGNIGGDDLKFEIKETDKGFTPAVHIPRFTGELPADTRPASAGPAPKTDVVTPAASARFPLASVGATAMDVYPDYNLVDIPDLTVPNSWNVIANEPGSQFFAGDFINGDFSTLYVIDYGLNTLIAIDTATGAQTPIGPSTPRSGETWTGLTGSGDGVMYGSTTNISRSTLYTIDLSTGAATEVGEITGAPAIIDIAINPAGEMYGVDIVNDVLIKIDPATGAGETVGPLGVGANYAQGMDFDDETGILYWAAYTASGELRIIDTSTGASALVGGFPSGAEVDSFGIRTFVGGDVPWVSEDPISGTIPTDGSQLVDVTFDASKINQPGTYKAELKVSVNSPYPGAKIPVSMIVPPPEDWGKLDGTVTDNCTGEVLKDVLVSIDGGVPITQTFSNGAGYYFAWLEQGPYSLAFSLAGYITNETDVTILPGEVVTLDVNLVPDRPCAKVSPTLIEAWVLTDTVEYQTEGLQIADPGAQDLTFDISEREIFPKSLAKLEPLGSPVVPVGSSTGNPVQQYKSRINANDIALLSTTDVSSSIEKVLTELGLGYDYYSVPPISGIDFAPYTTVIVGMDGGLIGSAEIQILREQVVDQGKRLIFMGGTCWQDFAIGVNSYLVANDTGNYCWQVTNPPQWTVTDPTNGLAEGMPDSYNFVGYYGGYYSIRVTDDTALVAGVNGENWPAFFYKGDYGAGDFIWLINSAYYYYWTDPSDYAYYKQALTNALNYSSVKKDVTWLFEEPVSGTVPAGTVQDVGIFLTSQYTDGTPMPLGTYTATLTISTNDPVTPKPKVTVIMHVVKEYLAPVPEFTASTVGVGNPTEFVNTSDAGIPPTKEYVWDFGDGITMTVGTADPVYHTYTTFGTFTVTLTACNVVDCVTVVHDVTVLPKEFFLPLLNKN